MPARNESIADELKRYVRFSDEDARALAAVREEVASSFRRITVEFYDRIREHEDAHAVFTSEEQIQRLQASLVVWLERVFGGVYDAVYFAKTEHVGRVHVRVGLPQRYVVSAMTVIRGSLMALISSPAARDALTRLLDIELAIMLEAYRSDALARLDRASTAAVAESGELIDITPVLIVGLDEAGVIVVFNAAAEALTGWARDEIRGHDFFELLAPKEARARFAGEGPVELALRLRSGKTRMTRWQIKHVPSGRRAGGATFAFGSDITDEVEKRSQMDQQLRLEAAGTLVAGLAHAVRNPLNGAGLHLALVERALAKCGPHETLDAVRVTSSELRRVGALVTDFLDFARPKPIVRARVDARTICERAIATARPDAEQAGVTIQADLPARPLAFEADALRLEQVLGHLISNAIEAQGEGGRVIVRARREPRHLWIEVEDGGPGLPDPEAPIFDAFYSTKPDGTGLGLAIVHRVVADHDGDINVESRPGATRFRLRLPLTRERLVT
jgi:PAS domain S-box-containing protein